MPLLRSLAGLGERMATNMALLTELGAEEGLSPTGFEPNGWRRDAARTRGRGRLRATRRFGIRWVLEREWDRWDGLDGWMRVPSPVAREEGNEGPAQLRAVSSAAVASLAA